MRPKPLHLLSLALPPLSFLLLLPLLHHFPRTPLPDCPHTLLITDARHGSTWLLDSIEHCRYSKQEQVEPGIYGKRVYLDTELWHIQPVLRNITVPQALQHLHQNSVKLFPTGIKDTSRIRRLLNSLASPVIVLRRIPKDACCSLEKAMKSGAWANVKGQTYAINDTCTCDEACERGCREWIRNTENYFGDVARLLHRSGTKADWLWYEQVKDLPVITLRNARCVIRNCNFVDT